MGDTGDAGVEKSDVVLLLPPPQYTVVDLWVAGFKCLLFFSTKFKYFTEI